MIALIIATYFLVDKFIKKWIVVPIIGLVAINIDYFDLIETHPLLNLDTTAYMTLSILNLQYIGNIFLKRDLNKLLYLSLCILNLSNLIIFQQVAQSLFCLFLLNKRNNRILLVMHLLGSLIFPMFKNYEYLEFSNYIIILLFLFYNFFEINSKRLTVILGMCFVVPEEYKVILISIVGLTFVLYELRYYLRQQRKVLSKNFLINKFFLKFLIVDKTYDNKIKKTYSENILDAKRQKGIETYNHGVKNNLILHTLVLFIILGIGILGLERLQ